MKKTPLFLLILSFLAACNLPFSRLVESQSNTPASTLEIQLQPLPETVINNTPLPVEINAPLIEAPSIISIEMLDEVHGWAITETQIARTNDGGVTWHDVTPQGLAAAGYGVFTEFHDINYAWVLAPDPDNYPMGGTLYRTMDGGMIWSSAGTPFSGGDLSFVDATRGWMMADLGAGAGSMAVSIFQTTDGGATWTRTYTNDPNMEGAGDTLPLGGLKGEIAPLDMNTAWISGVIYSPGMVYLFRTDDGGSTWSTINIDLSAEAQLSELSIERIEFVSASQGFLALRVISTDMHTILYSTTDGGNTWVPAPAKIPNAGRLNIVSEREIILYSSDQFYITRDAANTWNIVPPDIAFGDSLTSMSFANSNTGWVVTTDPSNHHALYKTTDGAATWLPIIP